VIAASSTQTDEQRVVASAIAFKLASLGLSAKFAEPISVGPIVSVYRFTPVGSTRVANIEALAQDFAIALGVEDVFVKRMPGEVAVGIFVPNRQRSWVKWRDCVGPQALNQQSLCRVPLLLGIDYLGRRVVEDLTLFPHLLIAGSTGSGKSTLLSSIIATVIYVNKSEDIKFVLSDTTGVEWGHFVGAPHLLFEPATNIYQTLERLDWLIEIMESRLKELSKYGLRNILEYNAESDRHQLHRKGVSSQKLPYIILIIDELSDLLADRRRENESRSPTLGKVAEAKLCQLAQKARKTGIHIIASTQRPSVKLVQGDIKANFPARLSFRLPSGADSRTVLGTEGAEHLLSRGDMLFINPNKPGLQRLHAAEASLEDIQAAVDVASRKEAT